MRGLHHSRHRGYGRVSDRQRKAKLRSLTMATVRWWCGPVLERASGGDLPGKSIRASREAELVTCRQPGLPPQPGVSRTYVRRLGEYLRDRILGALQGVFPSCASCTTRSTRLISFQLERRLSVTSPPPTPSASPHLKATGLVLIGHRHIRRSLSCLRRRSRWS